jgi:hypothetical protein
MTFLRVQLGPEECIPLETVEKTGTGRREDACARETLLPPYDGVRHAWPGR